MTLNQYQKMFEKLGLRCLYEIGTPRDTLAEWQSDFDLLDGLKKFPDKRITLFAGLP
jgi:hypothetical protein